jgi:ATP-dependent DNA helicase PIF1
MTLSVDEVLNYLINKRNVFITGGAGVGKTYNTREFLNRAEGLLQVIQCGTTGVSALNLPNGMTLHSAFALPVNEVPTVSEWVTQSRSTLFGARSNPYLSSIVNKSISADVLLIDEISMCSAWLLEMLDIRLRVWRQVNAPFGGMNILFVGDFLQLSPVYNAKAKPPPHPRAQLYAFESPVWHIMNLIVVNLTHIYRQLNMEFSNLCNQLREGTTLSEENRCMLKSLNRIKPPQDAMRVMVKRDDVYKVNSKAIQDLPGEMVTIPFPMAHYGTNRDMKDSLKRDVKQNIYIPYHEHVQKFKKGARVMLIINYKCGQDDERNPDDQVQYVNGDRGVVVGFQLKSGPYVPSNKTLERFIGSETHLLDKDPGIVPVVRFDRTNQLVSVNPHNFERKITQRSKSNPLKHDVKEHAQVLAIPLCLAWASTLQKVQGATICGKLHIDCALMNWIPASFYVALSRATDLDNVTFTGFHVEGKCYPKALMFYRGEYKTPPSNVLEVISKRVEQKDIEHQIELDRPWVDVLSNHHRMACDKRSFIDTVEEWVLTKREEKKGCKRVKR